MQMRNTPLKRSLSIVLALAMMISMVPVSAIPAGAVEMESFSTETMETTADASAKNESVPQYIQEPESNPPESQETEADESIPESSAEEETMVQESEAIVEEDSGSDAKQNNSAGEDETDPSEEPAEYVTEELLFSEESYGFKGETSAQNVASFFSNSGLVTNPTAANWVDRLYVEQKYLDFYNWLNQQTSGDATDALIVGSYTTPEGNRSNKYPVVSFAETIEYPTVDFTDLTQREAAYNNAQASVNAQYQDQIYLAQQSIRAVYPAFLRDHPGLFWLSGDMYMTKSTGLSCSYMTNGAGGSVTVTITINFGLCAMTDSSNTTYSIFEADYLNNPSAVLNDINKRDSAISAIIGVMRSEIDTDASKYEKLVWLNDYLTKTNHYNSYVAGGQSSRAGFHAWTCMGALIYHSGKNAPVCESYAKAFMLLCQQIGVACILVDGIGVTSSGGGAHMWNYVQMEDGNWYLCDATWNDPTGSENLASGFENRNYLLKGSNAVSSSHIVSNAPLVNGITYGTGPVLSADDYHNAVHYLAARKLVYSTDGTTGTMTNSESAPLMREITHYGAGDALPLVFYEVTEADGEITQMSPANVSVEGVTNSYNVKAVGINTAGEGQDYFWVYAFGAECIGKTYTFTSPNGYTLNAAIKNPDAHFYANGIVSSENLIGGGSVNSIPIDEDYLAYFCLNDITPDDIGDLTAYCQYVDGESQPKTYKLSLNALVLQPDNKTYLITVPQSYLTTANNSSQGILSVYVEYTVDGETRSRFISLYPTHICEWETDYTIEKKATCISLAERSIHCAYEYCDAIKEGSWETYGELEPHTFCECSDGTEECDNCVYSASFITKNCMTEGCEETCIVKVIGAAVASLIHADGSHENYAAVSAAVNAAMKGETVRLLKDTAEEMLYLRNNKIIDLNGHALTVGLFIGVNGTHLIDSSAGNTGILIADADAVQLSVSNSQFPVYTGTGYVFTEVRQYNHMLSNTSDGKNTQYVTQPMFEPFVHPYLGTSTDAVDVAVRVSWDFGTGISNQDYVYFDTQIRNVTSSYKPSTGKYGRAYSAVLKGIINTDTHALSGVLISATGAVVRAVDVTALIDRR